MNAPRLLRACRCAVSALALVAAGAGCTAARSASAPARPATTPAPPSPATVAPPPAATSAVPTTTPVTAPATTTTTSDPGPPYPVAEMTLPLDDPSRPTVSHGTTISASRSLPTLVWYPSRPGRWPLVVFAHGFDVTPDPYLPLLQTWASHGYVVAAPEFPLTDSAIAGPHLDESDIDNQPADVRFVTDQLVAPGGAVAARIDPARVAVAGHSDGAETALAASTTPAPAGEPPYRAVLVLSGQPVDGAAGRNPPILVVQGDADGINPPSYGYSAWAEAAAPKYLLVMRGAGHLPPYEAASPWLAGVERATLAVLDAYVARDAPAAAVPASVAGMANLSLSSG